ncbi:MAG: hypothetical protein OJF50_006273 [Nitrospira sp.]|jgi:hypothetical protein|nr:hypothetical protein [Nitrospira sp.]
MNDEEKTVFYLRDFPKEVARKIRAVALLKGVKLTEYVAAVLEAHVRELEQEGQLLGSAWHFMRLKPEQQEATERVEPHQEGRKAKGRPNKKS